VPGAETFKIGVLVFPMEGVRVPGTAGQAKVLNQAQNNCAFYRDLII